MNYSPLRYPGGKNKIAPFVGIVCVKNDIKQYYEPFAGGASVALFLLFEKIVKKVHINDKDLSIYAFWYSVLNKTEELCDLINRTEISMEEWRIQKSIHKSEKNSLLKLGFSTFYLNRVNRSGILTAGVIGGIKQQGNYLMDCRFNKSELIKRIRFIGKHSNKITITNLDALDMISDIESRRKTKSLIYFDPPYFDKGSTLYLNHYNHKDHEELSEKIKTITKSNWIVSYDNKEEIRYLYRHFRKKEFSFNHTAFKVREGKEIMFFDPSLRTPYYSVWCPTKYKMKRNIKEPKIVYVD